MVLNPCQHIIKPILTKKLIDHCSAHSLLIIQENQRRDGQSHFSNFFFFQQRNNHMKFTKWHALLVLAAVRKETSSWSFCNGLGKPSEGFLDSNFWNWEYVNLPQGLNYFIILSKPQREVFQNNVKTWYFYIK